MVITDRDFLIHPNLAHCPHRAVTWRQLDAHLVRMVKSFHFQCLLHRTDLEANRPFRRKAASIFRAESGSREIIPLVSVPRIPSMKQLASAEMRSAICSAARPTTICWTSSRAAIMTHTMPSDKRRHGAEKRGADRGNKR